MSELTESVSGAIGGTQFNLDTDDRTDYSVRWQIQYSKGVERIEAVDRVIENLIQYSNTLRRDAELEKLRQQFKARLAVLVDLLNNPDFVKQVKEDGYTFDGQAIIDSFVKASGWKFYAPLIMPIEKKS